MFPCPLFANVFSIDGAPTPIASKVTSIALLWPFATRLTADLQKSLGELFDISEISVKRAAPLEYLTVLIVKVNEAKLQPFSQTRVISAMGYHLKWLPFNRFSDCLTLDQANVRFVRNIPYTISDSEAAVILEQHFQLPSDSVRVQEIRRSVNYVDTNSRLVFFPKMYKPAPNDLGWCYIHNISRRSYNLWFSVSDVAIACAC